MFVGHGLLAFVLVAVGAQRLGWSRPAVVRVAVLAALFATLPDVDIVYALTGLAGVTPAVDTVSEAFWATGNQVHRGVTHSLVIAAVTATAAASVARPEASARTAGGAACVAVVAVVLAVSGPLAAVIATLFVVGAVGLVALAHWLDVSPAGVGGAAAVGLVTHPFGDLFTGAPPSFLYPFDVTVVSERVVLAGDPTLHLLAAFAIELAIVWLAVVVYFRLTDRRVAAFVDRRAVLGTGYAGAALALPAPTLEVSYHFVFSVLAVGTVGVSPPPTNRMYSWRGAITALAAITFAAGAYAVVYGSL